MMNTVFRVLAVLFVVFMAGCVTVTSEGQDAAGSQSPDSTSATESRSARPILGK